MRRWVILILTLLILCGCAPEPEAPTQAATPTEVPAATVGAEPAGFYAPGSLAETSTGGAVRLYPLPLENQYATGICPMGKDLLLFTEDAEEDSSYLTLLRNDSLYPAARIKLDCCIYPQDTAVQISEKGVTYYDAKKQELVFLGQNLQEVNRIALPETISGQPALSADRKQLYYCTVNALRCIDLDTKLDRLLKQISYEQLVIRNLHCEDTVIELFVADEDALQISLFISVRTGETLYEANDILSLSTRGDMYFCSRLDKVFLELLTGIGNQEPVQLKLDETEPSVDPVIEIGGVVQTVTSEEADITTLNFFDLTTGTRTSSVEIPDFYYPWNICADDTGAYIWFLGYDSDSEYNAIGRWDLEKTGTDDTESYFSQRFTFGTPDDEGLRVCLAQADSLSEKHGVEILIWTYAAAYQPWDYTLVPEHQVPVIQESLDVLDQTLSRFPEGFLKETASGSISGKLRICLLRSIEGNPEANVLTSANGLQYWDDNGNACLGLVMDSTVQQTIYHELFHVIESKVMSNCSAYDNWDDLNPEGFEYDYDYIKNLDREDIQWITSAEAAFIDYYAMSYPKEDRARIMEYAMLPNSEAYFESETMQKKLKQLCLGIREAYELEDAAETFLWEQYLAEPISAKE